MAIEGDATQIIEFTVIGDWEINGIVGAMKAMPLGWQVEGEKREVEVSEETVLDWTETEPRPGTFPKLGEDIDDSDIPF